MSTEQNEILEVGDKAGLICDDGPSAEQLTGTLRERFQMSHCGDLGAIERMKYTPYDIIVIAETFTGSNLETNGVLLGFKCHTAETSDRAIERMKYTPYDIIVIAETFTGSNLETNGVLDYLSPLPMA